MANPQRRITRKSTNKKQRPLKTKSAAQPKVSSSKRPLGKAEPLAVTPEAMVKYPPWLNFLQLIGQTSTLATFVLISGTLAVYGWSVYTQQIWNQSYQELQSLQRSERELTTNNSLVTNRLAEQAESGEGGLVRANENNTLFLQPVSEEELTLQQQQREKELAATTEDPSSAPSMPMGY
ncbi:MAG: hypothetical protein HC796_12415 [Synechococcaceae cyanobacterium RL_1_2]|nr:hypothetical protein [Synechococcaceae cyanobacterium RL_1_2]